MAVCVYLSVLNKVPIFLVHSLCALCIVERRVPSASPSSLGTRPEWDRSLYLEWGEGGGWIWDSVRCLARVSVMRVRFCHILYICITSVLCSCLCVCCGAIIGGGAIILCGFIMDWALSHPIKNIELSSLTTT